MYCIILCKKYQLHLGQKDYLLRSSSHLQLGIVSQTVSNCSCTLITNLICHQDQDQVYWSLYLQVRWQEQWHPALPILFPYTNKASPACTMSFDCINQLVVVAHQLYCSFARLIVLRFLHHLKVSVMTLPPPISRTAMFDTEASKIVVVFLIRLQYFMSYSSDVKSCRLHVKCQVIDR